MAIHDTVSLIIDSDMGPDSDDAGALALAHRYADQGKATILGVVCNTSDYAGRWGPPCFEAINAYYGRSDIPIGARRGPGNDRESDTESGPNCSLFAESIAKDDRFENTMETGEEACGAVELYRKLLGAAATNEVTIVSIGYLSNLRNLLNSTPDEHSKWNGEQLVSRKVDQLVVMGGEYPERTVRNWNFENDKPATKRVVEDWPTTIVYTGREVGERIMTGAVLSTETPPTNPVRAAYELYHDGAVKNNNSYDLTAVHYAVEGLDDRYVMSDNGHVDFDVETGEFSWKNAPPRNGNYLMLDDDPDAIAEYYDSLITQPPSVNG